MSVENVANCTDDEKLSRFGLDFNYSNSRFCMQMKLPDKLKAKLLNCFQTSQVLAFDFIPDVLFSLLVVKINDQP